MSSIHDLAIRTINYFAELGAKEIQNNIASIDSALQTLVTALEEGKDTPTLQVERLTLIELQIQNESCIQTIKKIKGFLLPWESIFDLLVDSPQEAVLKLQQRKNITLDEATGTLCFSGKLVGRLNYKLFEGLLENMSAQFRSQVRLFALKDFPALGVGAPALLLRHCPNLSFDSFQELPEEFFDHTIVTQEGSKLRVNMGLLTQISSVFRQMWNGGMKEAHEKEQGRTHLPDHDHAQFSLFLELLMGKQVSERDINVLASMAEFFERYDLFRCQELQRRYVECMKPACTALERENVLTLIRGFQPFFRRGLLESLRAPLALLACPLPLPREDDREGLFSFINQNQEILSFLFDTFKTGSFRDTFELDFRDYAIQLIKSRLPLVEPFLRFGLECEITNLQKGVWKFRKFLSACRDNGFLVKRNLHPDLLDYVHKQPVVGDTILPFELLLIKQIKSLPAEDLFELLLQYGTLTSSMENPDVHGELYQRMRELLRSSMTEATDSEVWRRFSTLAYVKEHLLQIAGLEGDSPHLFFVHFFSTPDPEKHLEKALGFIDFCESIAPTRTEQYNFARAAFLRLHPDPECQEKAFALFSDLAAQTKWKAIRNFAKFYLIDIRRARGEREGLLQELKRMSDETSPQETSQWNSWLGRWGKRYYKTLRALLTRAGVVLGPDPYGPDAADEADYRQARNFHAFTAGQRRFREIWDDPEIPWKLGPFLSIYRENP